jgi:AraC-like DNA-binding protein
MSHSVLDLPMTAAYFRLILRRFGSTPSGLAALAAGTGVPDAADEISVRAQLRQLANLRRLAAPHWGLELGAALDGSTHGPAGAIVVTAASVGAALDALARYATVRTPFIDLRATREAGRYRLEVVETCELGAVRTSLLEMVLMSTQGVVESALGQRMDGATFHMPAPRPAYWRRYAAFLHAPVRFEGHVAAVSLPSQWLELPCPLADRVVHRSATVRLESMRRRVGEDFIDVRVERMLDVGDDAGASLGDIAARLGISSRTLVRRLGRRNRSYRVLLDGHRRQRAIELLAEPALTVAEVSERLGYEAPTNFGRACRRWFGMSPSDYRRARSSKQRIASVVQP